MISRSLLPQAIWMGERLLWAAFMLAPLPTRYFTPSNELPMQAYVRGVSPTSSTASNWGVNQAIQYLRTRGTPGGSTHRYRRNHDSQQSGWRYGPRRP